MTTHGSEDEALRSVALQNAQAILVARQRAEEQLVRAREALRESQERLETALLAASTATFRWSPNTGLVEWDGHLDRLLGLADTSNPVALDEILTRVHADDADAVRAAHEACVTTGAPLDLEFRVTSLDDHPRWVHEKAQLVPATPNRPAHVTGAVVDVTRRMVAESAQRASEERMRALFNQAAVGMAVADLGGRFVDMNRKFAELLGYTPEELRALTFSAITHPDDLPETEAYVRDLLQGGRDAYSVEKRYRRKNGSLLWAQATVTMARDITGQPHHFIGVVEDITGRKEAEAALHDETRVLELLNRTGTVLVSSLDLQAIVQAVTDAATELSGAAFGAFFYNVINRAGENYLLFTLSGAPREAFERFGNPRATALFGPTFRGEGPIRSGDILADPRYGLNRPNHGMPRGHLPVRSYLAVPVASRSGEVLGGLFFGHPEINVFTERAERLVVGIAAQAAIAIDNARLFDAAQRASEERAMLLESERAARAAAERLSDVKDTFLATLSHELRTPLNAILGWAHILRSTADAPETAKGLDTILRNARMQAQMIEDLLDMSRIASGKLRLDVQPLQPIAFVESAIETVRPAADAKGLRLDVLLDPAAGPVSGDANRLQQVTWNLLSNAIKFTPKGGKVQVLLERVNSHIELTVADTGKGIGSDSLPHLFDRFRQEDASTTREQGGLGLGLSIVKSLVELHGGTVNVTSPGPNQGTTATVHLPLLVAHERSSAANREHPRVPGRTAGTAQANELAGVSVLVVDDQADARELIQRILEGSGAEVRVAASAEAALAALAAETPDVLVSDIGMPNVDGYELVRRLRHGRSAAARIPAIALTAFARSEDRTRALRAGFNVHVAKPVDPAELVATVASVAGRV